MLIIQNKIEQPDLNTSAWSADSQILRETLKLNQKLDSWAEKCVSF